VQYTITMLTRISVKLTLKLICDVLPIIITIAYHIGTAGQAPYLTTSHSLSTSQLNFP
jgi:hypothetical protein